jgi:HK97 family phage portal protein
MSIWTPSDWLDIFRGSDKNARSGWKTAAVWYGINRISGNVGTLNLNLYRKTGDDTDKVETGISYWTLRKRPSPIYSPLTFKQTMTAQALWHGNGRAFIYRSGPNSELIILDPASTTTGMVDGEKYHATYVNPQSDTPDNRMQLFRDMLANPSKTVIIPDSECFHIQGFGDGVQGVPLYVAAKTSLESMLGADCRANDQINRGFVAKIMLNAPAESPQFRSQEQANEFLDDFIKKHGADGGNQQVGLLRGGITANSISAMDNNSAQFVETRKYLRQDAALWLMLESMLGDNESESYNSLEQRQISYLLNCLDTWLTRWEEEADYKLLTPTQFNSGRYYHKFNTAAMLRTDLQTTATTFASLIAARVINPNEARAKMEMNPYDGGDEFINPAITQSPGSAETTGSEQENTDDKGTAAVNNRVQHFLTIEEKQVNKRLMRGDTYDSISEWYDKFSQQFGNAIEGLGGDRLIAQHHCVESLRYIARSPKRFDLSGSAEILTDKILEKEHV